MGWDDPGRGTPVQKSWAWLLLPLLLAILGGIIGYLMLHRVDNRRAKDCLYLGIAVTVLGIIGAAAQLALLGSVPQPGINV